MVCLINSSQFLFDKALLGLWIAFKLIIKLVAYLPLWFVAYMITTTILEKNDNGLAWIGLIILFTILIYQVVFFAKGITIGLRDKGNQFWLLIFILCFSFTCVLPVWLVYKNIHPYLHKLSPGSGNVIAWITAFIFGIYVYSRYQFLTNIVPLAASVSFHLGRSVVSKSSPIKTAHKHI